MEPIPLIPKAKGKGNHDVSAILREAFQEMLGEEVLPTNVTRNIQKYNTENLHLKNVANVAQYASVRADASDLDIGTVEDKLMYNQTRFLVIDNYLNSQPLLKEHAKLRHLELFSDVEVMDARQFGLIRNDDLGFCLPEIAIDFRLQVNKPEYQICQEDDAASVRVEAPSIKEPPNLESHHRKKKAHVVESLQLNPNRLRRTDVSQEINAINLNIPGEKFVETKEKIFKVTPKQTVFYNYKLNKTYKRKIMVQNITPTTKTFEIHRLPRSKYFEMSSGTQLYRVAAGMSVEFTVVFKTDTYLDVFDSILFDTYDAGIIDAKLISYRNSPSLRGFVCKNEGSHKSSFGGCSEDYDARRSIALNSTIDCGSCLLGSGLQLNLLMHNDGGDGDFFIITEEEWYLKRIEDAPLIGICKFNFQKVNSNMELTMDVFKMHPCYFTIKEDEYAEVDVIFYPTDYGLHVETLYLLCNNNSVERLEIIGDGVLYEKNFIKVHAPIKQEAMSYTDEESTHYFNCGVFLPRHKQIKTFTISNDSCLNLRYRTEWRKSNCHVKNTTLKRIKKKWISIAELKYLPSYTEVDLEITICCETYVPGLYSIVLMLYTTDVPEVSLEEDKDFNVVSKPNRTTRSDGKIVDVIVAEVEISCQIVPFQVTVIPNPFCYPLQLDYKEIVEQLVRIRTNTKLPLRCKWILDKDDPEFEIAPSVLTLQAGSDNPCQMKIKSTGYDDIARKITLSVEGGIFEVYMNVKAKVEKPRCGLTASMINLGLMTKLTKIQKTFYVKNMSQEEMDWVIMEFIFDSKTNSFVEVKNRVKPFSGKLTNFGDKEAISYKIKTSKLVIWSSFLILITSHKSKTSMDDVCFVNYKVTQPLICMHSAFSPYPVLFCNQILHKDIASVHKICLHNMGEIAAFFVWGSVVGQQADYMDVKCSPKSGVIEPGHCARVDVELTPLDVGVMEHIYVPCFVGKLDGPIMLRVLCVVDDIFYNVHLPNDKDGYDCVFWPPRMVNDYDIGAGEYDFGKDFVPEEQEMELSASAYKLCMKNSQFSLPKVPTRVSFNFNSSHSGSINVGGYRDNGFFPYDQLGEEEASRVDYDFPVGPEQEVKQSLRDFLGSEFTFQENVLEFHNVPLHTPVVKSIYIENLTPLFGNVELGATHFFGAEVSEEKQIMDNALFKWNLKKSNEFKECMNMEGMVIKAKPCPTVLKPKETLKIDIYVYAISWGVYCDEIILEVNDILPFCFTIIVEVVGSPIEFPFAVNTIQGEPTCRFGVIPYNSLKTSRKIKVRNISTVPVTIMWHLFLKEEESEEFPSRQYFNVIFDMYNTFIGCEKSSLEIVDGQLLLTEDFHGWADYRTFQASPSEMYLEDRASGYINVEIDPQSVEMSQRNSELVAYLIGVIYVSNCFMYKQNAYRRLCANNITPAKMKISAILEYPQLKFLTGERFFSMYACDIISAGVITLHTVLTLKNCNKCSTSFVVSVRYPFKVVKIITKDIEFQKCGVVDQGQCVNVYVTVTVLLDEAIDMSQMFYSKDDMEDIYGVAHFENRSLTVDRHVNITQNNEIDMAIPITLVIYFPDFEVDKPTVDFDIVYIGCVVTTNMLIKNKSAQDIPFSIKCSSPDLIANPPCGILKKSTGIQYQCQVLTISFRPLDTRVYQENVRISTNIPSLFRNIVVTGRCTRNQKYK